MMKMMMKMKMNMKMEMKKKKKMRMKMMKMMMMMMMMVAIRIRSFMTWILKMHASRDRPFSFTAGSLRPRLMVVVEPCGGAEADAVASKAAQLEQHL